jgi:urease accessory protein
VLTASLLTLSEAPSPSDTLTLPFDIRQKSRFKAQLDSGREIVVRLPRGSHLHDGALLEASDGGVILVKAATEEVSRVSTPDAHLLARAAYHLGNRHVPLQIEPGRLSYLHDHVLDDMLERLGLEVVCEAAPFEPEHGAYGHGSSHGHEH